LQITDAFAKFGAKLNNYRWSVSAFGDGPCLVLALYKFEPWLKYERGSLTYRDTLSAWQGNAIARKEMIEHLGRALAESIPIRMVGVRCLNKDDEKRIGKIADESVIPKDFSVDDHLIGTLDSLDGDTLTMVFRWAHR
jgi:hypothetical protein